MDFLDQEPGKMAACLVGGIKNKREGQTGQLSKFLLGLIFPGKPELKRAKNGGLEGGGRQGGKFFCQSESKRKTEPALTIARKGQGRIGKKGDTVGKKDQELKMGGPNIRLVEKDG